MQRTRWILVLSLLLTLGLSWSLMAGEPTAAPSHPAREEIGKLPNSAEPLLLPGEGPGSDKLFLGPCTATLKCPDGSKISCSGSDECYASDPGGYVECDGRRTTCTSCQVTLFCQCKCRTVSTSCISESGDCQQTADSITCDGLTIRCSQLCLFDGCPGFP